MEQQRFAALRLTLASPEQIRAWSYGEVTSADTINYQTHQPVPGGLFCERIFGPTKDWTCACRKYRRPRDPGFCCPQCGVEIVERFVRRERLGHIQLAAPVVHPWFRPMIASLLGLSRRELSLVLGGERVLVTALDKHKRDQCLVAHAQTAEDTLEAHLRQLTVGSLIDPAISDHLSEAYPQVVEAGSGAETLQTLLAALDLDALAASLRKTIAQQDQPASVALLRRLRIVEAFRTSGVDPSWMILTVLPVLPPDLRPLVRLRNGSFAASDTNVFYERILRRNARIKHFRALDAPVILLQHEKRLLQDVCDALFDNSHRSHPLRGSHGQALKSLTDAISGKHGRLRRNLLGKRVDYSGRSVIVGDASLKLHQCGLPTRLCLELFKPFVMRLLVERRLVASLRAAKRLVERASSEDPILWDVLEDIMEGKVVLLNRAPTLHRLSIQGFFPVRVEGNAIRLHPLVCSAFNADFDGDQMAVHLPLFDEAQQEARELLLSTQNLRAPASGDPAISITQEQVLGLFYLTQEHPSPRCNKRVFTDAHEACLALDQHQIALQTPIMVRVEARALFAEPRQGAPLPAHRRILTTAGRLLLNDVLPAPLRYKNYAFTKDAVKQLIAECLEVCGQEATVQMADALKRLGFHYATRSGISFAISDIEIPAEKKELVTRGEQEVAAIEEQMREGMLTDDERRRLVIALWTRTTKEVEHGLEQQLDLSGPLGTIVRSGATKAKFQQIRQLCGMRGLLARPNGDIIEMPVKSSYLEGMSTRDAFIASSAARAGFMARSLNTATTGYLTRKLVENGMDVWITCADCGTRDGLLLTQKESQDAGFPDLVKRLVGRVLAEAIDGLPAGTLLTNHHAQMLVAAGVQSVRIRSVLTCQAAHGICQQCYGIDLATGLLVRQGVAVGVIAGQSIGEPGTQLSMQAFHSGGIAHAAGDIRQGLPRVIDLFEARTPGLPAVLAPFAGKVLMHTAHVHGETTVGLCNELGETWSQDIPAHSSVLVKEGQHVIAGQALTTGTPDLRALLQIGGRDLAARFLLSDIQRVFRETGVYLADKHIECMLRQMLRSVQILSSGETCLIPGSIIDRFQFARINSAILSQGGCPALARPILFGLTRATLHTDSWIAAASFQQTGQVLAWAAIRGQTDHLHHLKARVVLGRRIPTPQDPDSQRHTTGEDCASPGETG